MAVTYLRSCISGAESLRGDVDTTNWSVFHERFEFVVIHSGHCVATYRGRTISGPGRTISAFEPGNLHRNPQNDATTFQVLILDPALVARILPEGLLVQNVHFAPVCPTVSAPILELHRQTHRLFDDQAEPLELERSIIRLFATSVELLGEKPLASRLGTTRRDDTRARSVLSRLDAEFDQKLTLDDLSSEARCDKFHLLRCFKALFGVAPHQYVIQKRVSEARRLLAQGERPASVAQSVGFHDQSHLTRHFKRIAGVTPRAYVLGTARSKS
jgi:AraC-like DNA-binding protein